MFVPFVHTLRARGTTKHVNTNWQADRPANTQRQVRGPVLCVQYSHLNWRVLLLLPKVEEAWLP